MQLSKKQKNFWRFFPAFFKAMLNFENFENKDDSHRFFISKITESENVVI